MALYGASGVSHGLGFGRPTSRAILGEKLNLAVPVRLDQGEDLPGSCVVADVYFGDDKVSPSDIHTAVLAGPGSSRIIRISSGKSVYEPVVTVYLAAGCQAKVTRKFVVFADPSNAPQPAGPDTDDDPIAGAPPVALPPGVGLVGGQMISTGNITPAAPSSTAPSRSARSAASAGKKAVPIAAAASAPPFKVSSAAEAGPRASKKASPVKKAPVEQRERLMLDPVDADAAVVPSLRMSMGLLGHADGDAPSAEVQAKRAAAAALWQALNASPEQLARDRQRIQELEQRLSRIQQESEQAHRAVVSMQARVQQAEAHRQSPLLLYVAAGLSLVLGAVLAMLLMRWRYREAEQAKSLDWLSGHSSIGPDSIAPSALPTSESALERTSAGFKSVEQTRPDPASTGQAVSVAAPVAVAPAPVTRGSASPTFIVMPEATPAAPARVASKMSSHEPLRAVSVEELIDLEQQAEFFIVLGQDDAAIDLLEGHVHSTTGASPLPFLKLLEIYRRVGKRSDYERVQSEFNARFNGYAPSWDSDLNQGHRLEDYPGIVERIQELWQTPARAMDVLERSLTRSDEDIETFDLPAYRELLLLYSVARDLSERESETRQTVDLSPRFPDVGEHDASEVDDGLEPLMATRPVKAVPHAQPSLSVDLSLDDLEPLNDPPKDSLAGGQPRSQAHDGNTIEFERVDIPKL